MVPKPAPFWTDGIIPFNSVCTVTVPITDDWQTWQMRFTPGGDCLVRQAQQEATAEPEEEDNSPYVSRECRQCLRVHRKMWECK